MSGYYANPSGGIEYVEGEVRGAFPGDSDERPLILCDGCSRWQRGEVLTLRVDHDTLTLRYCERCQDEYTEICSDCSTTFQVDDLEMLYDGDDQIGWRCESCDGVSRSR